MDLQTQSEWDVQTLDLDAYLDRIRYAGSLGPTVETLQSLHRAHLAAIPFENLEIILGRGVSLELGAIQEKLVHRRRGGYCFEQNLLFSAALEQIGFNLARLAARVQPDRPGPRTHMCVLVEADGERWLADVGFGTTLLEAVPLREGAISHQGGWTYRLDRDGGGFWRLRGKTREGWVDEYAFTLEPQRLVDYVVFNHYTSTHPGSPFVRQPVALRKTPDWQYALRGSEFTISAPDGPIERHVADPDDLGRILDEQFGIRLSDDDLARLRAHPGNR